jgi:hypothetical protein
MFNEINLNAKKVGQKTGYLNVKPQPDTKSVKSIKNSKT